ncbi:hypothetical protein K1719_038509 [Acacia pycnantha]|nr:hypothetical protein K1719_038509 [Acacia pycnantha]
MEEESNMSSDWEWNVPFSWQKVSLTREEEELLQTLPLLPYKRASTKKGLLWWMQDDDPFLAAYKVFTKSDKWRNLRKRFMSISSRKRSSAVWDINLVNFSHTQVKSEEKTDDVSKLHRPVSLTREEEELLNTLPLPPCMAVAGRSRKVRASVHQDIWNLPVPLCVFQPPYDRRSAKKGRLWWKQQDDDPFLAAYKVCTRSDKWRNLRKRFRSISSSKRSGAVWDINLVSFSPTQVKLEEKTDDVSKLHRPVSLTAEEEELLDTIPLPPCMAVAGRSRKVHASVHQDILNLPVPLCVFQPPYDRRSTKKGRLWWKQQDDDPFLAAYNAVIKEDDKKSKLTKRFMSS